MSPLSWSQFLQRVPGIELIPRFAESELAVMFDKALCGFGAGHQGPGLQNENFPWDFEAFLYYCPMEFVWFLLKHINSSSREAGPQPLSPLRVSIASLVMLPWEDLIKWCGEYKVLEKFLRGFDIRAIQCTTEDMLSLL